MRRAIRIMGAVVMLGFASVAAALIVLAWTHPNGAALPRPTGPYAVGRAFYDWLDENRIDPLAPAPGTKRELPVWIWYPASPDSHARAVNAYEDADIAPGPDRFPVVLLKPARGAAAVQYTTLAEDLASHGYIVVGSDSPHTTDVCGRVRGWPRGHAIRRRGAS